MSTNQDKCHDGIESNGNLNKEETRKTWVKFDDESPQTNGHQSDGKISSTPSTSLPAQQEVPAVLNTETVHVNLERGDRNLENTSHGNLSKDVEFVNIRTGFSNGDLLVTVLPVNVSWPWITLARFRPELVPEELMAQGLTLTVEEYVHAMELLVNDARFTIYNMCYKRVIFCWITVAFVVLLCLLFSGITGKVLFSLGVSWLVLSIAGIILCMEIKRKLTKGVELCLGKINKSLAKHNLLLALDDRGKISCHKLNLCFIYFDSGPCIAHIQQFIESEEGKAVAEGWEKRLGITVTDIVIQGSQTTRLSRKEDMAELVYYRYLQRWGKDYLRRNLYWTLDEEGGIPAAPRHLPQALCPCQYVEEIMRYKEPQEKTAYCAPLIN